MNNSFDMKVEWALTIQPHHKDLHQTELLRKSQFIVGDAVDSIRQAAPNQLQTWSRGPLYLANGEAETPLGWVNTTIRHDQAFTIPAAVLSSKALAYAVVLGLDFIFFSGMHINVTDQKYSFKFSPAKEYAFQPGNASLPIVNPQQENLQQQKTQNLSLLSSIPPPSLQLLIQQPYNVDERMLIKNAVDEAHLPPDGKQQLLSILESNPRVCTLRTGPTCHGEAIHANPVPRNLKEKGHRFQWTPQCQQGFEQLKSCLTSPPILGHPDLQLPFTVYTGSDTGLGAILAQRKDAGRVAIACASRTLTGAELNYTATEKECLAVVWALKKWQHYLEHKPFTVVTDHSALQWVMSSTKTTSRLIRWVLRLQKFDFIIEYRKGKLNVAPDALSRSSPTLSCSLYTSFKEPELPLSDVVLWEEQHKDHEIIKLLQAVAENNASLMDQYEVVEDKLYHKTYLPNNQLHYRVYVPSSLRPSLLQHYHSSPLSGHEGIYKTYK
ncbi:Transposon Tf2-6 polyprotein [Labeo rohita]|uniref:Transposon Tf2-6 polyprotein n=1 Tax=Labeo rohita TaxID=84645 RepID=A0ABQ8L6Y0_LABRO|nr:Transposon Tf2-6 polyprotein [Labeo rohita]